LWVRRLFAFAKTWRTASLSANKQLKKDEWVSDKYAEVKPHNHQFKCKTFFDTPTVTCSKSKPLQRSTGDLSFKSTVASQIFLTNRHEVEGYVPSAQILELHQERHDCAPWCQTQPCFSASGQQWNVTYSWGMLPAQKCYRLILFVKHKGTHRSFMYSAHALPFSFLLSLTHFFVFAICHLHISDCAAK